MSPDLQRLVILATLTVLVLASGLKFYLPRRRDLHLPFQTLATDKQSRRERALARLTFWKLPLDGYQMAAMQENFPQGIAQFECGGYRFTLGNLDNYMGTAFTHRFRRDAKRLITRPFLAEERALLLVDRADTPPRALSALGCYAEAEPLGAFYGWRSRFPEWDSLTDKRAWKTQSLCCRTSIEKSRLDQRRCSRCHKEQAVEPDLVRYQDISPLLETFFLSLPELPLLEGLMVSSEVALRLEPLFPDDYVPPSGYSGWKPDPSQPSPVVTGRR